MELVVSVLWDLELSDHGDNEGVDGSGDSCKWTGKLDFIGEPNWYAVNTLAMSSPEVAEPMVFSVRAVLEVIPVRRGSSRFSPGTGRRRELSSLSASAAGGRLREGGSWRRRTVTGAGSGEITERSGGE